MMMREKKKKQNAIEPYLKYGGLSTNLLHFFLFC